jgi:plasmid stabilization system protein ParE
LNLRIHRLAVAEIDRQVDYYESWSAGLGAELEDEIDAVLETILQFPRAAPQARDRPDHRVAILERFPFRFVYQVKGDEI